MMVKIETFRGELEVEYVYENSLGYHAVTGNGLNQKTWHLTKDRYDNLKQQLGVEA